MKMKKSVISVSIANYCQINCGHGGAPKFCKYSDKLSTNHHGELENVLKHWLIILVFHKFVKPSICETHFYVILFSFQFPVFTTLRDPVHYFY